MTPTAPSDPAAPDAGTQETPWTPGPWHVEDPLGPEILSILAGGPDAYDWLHVAQLSVDAEPDEMSDQLVIPETQVKANARLIATAPDLFSALRGIVALWDGVDDADLMPDVLSALTAARTVIARATAPTPSDAGRDQGERA